MIYLMYVFMALIQDLGGGEIYRLFKMVQIFSWCMVGYIYKANGGKNMAQSDYMLTAAEYATIEAILDRGNDAEIKLNKAKEIVIYEV